MSGPSEIQPTHQTSFTRSDPSLPPIQQFRLNNFWNEILSWNESLPFHELCHHLIWTERKKERNRMSVIFLVYLDPFKMIWIFTCSNCSLCLKSPWFQLWFCQKLRFLEPSSIECSLAVTWFLRNNYKWWMNLGWFWWMVYVCACCLTDMTYYMLCKLYMFFLLLCMYSKYWYWIFMIHWWYWHGWWEIPIFSGLFSSSKAMRWRFFHPTWWKMYLPMWRWFLGKGAKLLVVLVCLSGASLFVATSDDE